MKQDKSKSFLNYPPKIKWVKKAQSFCKTYFFEGKQKQEWYVTKP